jgi:hypothetical protein
MFKQRPLAPEDGAGGQPIGSIESVNQWTSRCPNASVVPVINDDRNLKNYLTLNPVAEIAQ